MQVHTCPPALGFSFAAGTTDGPGEFDFVQGQLSLLCSDLGSIGQEHVWVLVHPWKLDTYCTSATSYTTTIADGIILCRVDITLCQNILIIPMPHNILVIVVSVHCCIAYIHTAFRGRIWKSILGTSVWYHSGTNTRTDKLPQSQTNTSEHKRHNFPLSLAAENFASSVASDWSVDHRWSPSWIHVRQVQHT